ncbi:hypothetical protein KGF56_001237 [Candida oxycetoniae]|uniref:Sodium/calcium exchanger membrane region domain-containing protein n=1 Tax=Candida oxycetoniae TaxID=497107 RepID=A0AAI9SZH5_9ASCO|nr:uncharacterized protein KGF56_001237 [Candida oxycetoniae]KAI3406018.2 hypothetical protein KGF56_001237 [Candida oxycetoniae]
MSLDPSSQCVLPHSVFAGKDICNYIESHCDVSYFKISQIYYCRYHNLVSLIFISSIALLALCLILLALSILVSNYLFRNLNELTTKFGLSNQILSFILIPLTNSFPDIINYFVVLRSGSSNLVIGQLMGSLLIIFTVIIGLISILIENFTIEYPKLLIIDLSWILIVLILFSYILSDGKITSLECITMSMVYVAYIAFLSIFDKERLKDYDEELVIGHDEHQHLIEQPYNIEDALSIISNEETGGEFGSIETRSRSASPRLSPVSTRCPSPLPATSPKGDRDSERESYLSIHYVAKMKSSSSSPPTAAAAPVAAPAPAPAPASRHLQQIRIKIMLTHIFQTVCNCIDFILIFLIPFHKCIENEDSHWKLKIRYNRIIRAWYFFEVPLLINYQFFKFPVVYVMPLLLIFSPTMLIVKSIGHDIKLVITSILGIITSLIVISNISVYILQMLKNIGIIWNISEYLLGMLVFAVSNSINDVITNVTLATKINPILGINSCLGTPLLIILLGVGFNGFVVLQNSKKHSIKFDLKPSVILDTAALIFTISFILIYLPWNKWRLDRKLGICLICWYLVITFINLYLE